MTLTASMVSTLANLNDRFEEVSGLLADPDVMGDRERFTVSEGGVVVDGRAGIEQISKPEDAEETPADSAYSLEDVAAGEAHAPFPLGFVGAADAHQEGIGEHG